MVVKFNFSLELYDESSRSRQLIRAVLSITDLEITLHGLYTGRSRILETLKLGEGKLQKESYVLGDQKSSYACY